MESLEVIIPSQESSLSLLGTDNHPHQWDQEMRDVLLQTVVGSHWDSSYGNSSVFAIKTCHLSTQVWVLVVEPQYFLAMRCKQNSSRV